MRAVLLSLTLAACKAEPEPAPPAWVDATTLPNPIVPDVALLPWPSEQHLAPDAASRTGWRISLPRDLLADDLSPEMFAADDGCSRVPPIVTALPGGVDPTSLPDRHDWGATLDVATSPVLLLRLPDLTPVPLLVEVDVTDPDPSSAALLLRPHRALDPDTRYLVVLRDGLRAADGSPAVGSPFVQAALAGEGDETGAGGFWRHALHGVADQLTGLGIEPAEVLQAWTLRTRSEANVTAVAIATQDAVATRPLGEWRVEATVYEADRALIYGQLTVPRFLDPENRIHLDADGVPIEHGTMEAPFLITIPSTVRSTRPTVLFGHGFFSAIEEPTWSNLFDGLAQWEMAAVTTEFLGFSESSLAAAAPIFAGQLTLLDTILDQQLQSHANFTLVHRLITDILADAVEVDFGDGFFKPLDATNVPYMGISNGGTQGLVMMTTSPVLTRGALVVPGGGWSHMLQRAAQWNELGLLLQLRHPDERELQLVMSLVQQTFDRVDSLNYVGHLMTDRLEGRPPDPQVLMVEAVGDAQVSNLVTDWVAGNAGVALLSPAPHPVWGLEAAAAAPPGDPSLRGALAIYDLGLPPLPEGNEAPEENGAHNDVRLLQAYRDQLGQFLETGTIVQTCDGPSTLR